MMERIKCITFEKEAQDALPEHIKAKMKADREKARTERRYWEISSCNSPEGLSWVIWTKELEEAMQSSRDCYRKPFVQWIDEYVADAPHVGWKYNTPRKIAEAIWVVFRNEDDDHFEKLRSTLVDWIENYKETINV
ncbi:MAG: hypothetical protein LBT43_18570 [Prevotella sp.]|nr:hypothetical protein [Prevotella sp.]